MRYLLGLRGERLLSELDDAPYDRGMDLARALTHEDQAARARALATGLSELLREIDARRLR